ncbi:MAG: NTP transferase domain-containing protein [Nitrospinae bacterium]|nr:NTP transferase domain-containing protein [Nitrospinota bacterium]
MRSDIPKVLHPISGRPMLEYVIDLANNVGSSRVIIIIGYQGERIRDIFSHKGVEFAEQREQMGTGHAVLQAEVMMKDFNGDVLVLSGDVPLLKRETINELIKRHRDTDAVATLLTAFMNDPTGYGRVIHGEGNLIKGVVEERDSTPHEKGIIEVNSGTYCFKKDFLFDALHKIDKRNIQGEYYLTDVVRIAGDMSLQIGGVTSDDPLEIMGVNTMAELAKAEEIIKNRNKL